MSSNLGEELSEDIFQMFEQTLSMEEFLPDAELLALLTQLIVDRRSATSVTDQVYLDNKLQTVGGGSGDESYDTKVKDKLFYMFMTYRKYEAVINEILDDYEDKHKLNNDRDIARVVVFVLLFQMKKYNLDKLKDNLLEFSTTKTKKLVNFLSSYNVVKTMCKHVDKDYVEKVLKVQETQDVIRQLKKKMFEKKVSFVEEKPKCVPKPFSTNYVKPEKAKTDPTCEKEEDKFVFKAKPIPFDILYPDEEEINRQKVEKEIKKEIRARTMLEEANKKMFRCAQTVGLKKELEDETETMKVPKIKARKVQNFPPVEIKTNAAQTLREAARVMKEEEQFEKMIESLANGSFCKYDYENYLEDLRKQKETEELEKIERKKLETLITHEEAILAKKRLIEKNKMEKDQFCREWEEYEKKMNECKEKEMNELKLRFFIDTKVREKTIQEKMKDIVSKKSKLVQEENRKAKEDQDRRMVELERELIKKKELVCQIRLLQEIAKINNDNRSEFDETECANNGFMYEMSLAELKLRLEKMEIDMKEELERKKEEIMEEKIKKQKMLEDKAKLVEDARTAKRELRECHKKMKTKDVHKGSKCTRNSNMDLKKKLAQVIQERVEFQASRKGKLISAK